MESRPRQSRNFVDTGEYEIRSYLLNWAPLAEGLTVYEFVC